MTYCPARVGWMGWLVGIAWGSLIIQKKWKRKQSLWTCIHVAYTKACERVYTWWNPWSGHQYFKVRFNFGSLAVEQLPAFSTCCLGFEVISRKNKTRRLFTQYFETMVVAKEKRRLWGILRMCGYEILTPLTDFLLLMCSYATTIAVWKLSMQICNGSYRCRLACLNYFSKFLFL